MRVRSGSDKFLPVPQHQLRSDADRSHPAGIYTCPGPDGGKSVSHWYLPGRPYQTGCSTTPAKQAEDNVLSVIRVLSCCLSICLLHFNTTVSGTLRVDILIKEMRLLRCPWMVPFSLRSHGHRCRYRRTI